MASWLDFFVVLVVVVRYGIVLLSSELWQLHLHLQHLTCHCIMYLLSKCRGAKIQKNFWRGASCGAVRRNHYGVIGNKKRKGNREQGTGNEGNDELKQQRDESYYVNQRYYHRYQMYVSRKSL